MPQYSWISRDKNLSIQILDTRVFMDIGSTLRLARNVVSHLRVIVIEATCQADQCESGG